MLVYPPQQQTGVDGLPATSPPAVVANSANATRSDGSRGSAGGGDGGGSSGVPRTLWTGAGGSNSLESSQEGIQRSFEQS